MTFSLFRSNRSSSSYSLSSSFLFCCSCCLFVVPSSFFFATVTPLNLTVTVFSSPSSKTSVAHVLHTIFNVPTAVAFFEIAFGVHLIVRVKFSSFLTIFGSTTSGSVTSYSSLKATFSPSFSLSNRYSQIFQFRFVSFVIFTLSSVDCVISTTPNRTTGWTSIARSDTSFASFRRRRRVVVASPSPMCRIIPFVLPENGFFGLSKPGKSFIPSFSSPPRRRSRNAFHIASSSSPPKSGAVSFSSSSRFWGVVVARASRVLIVPLFALTRARRSQTVARIKPTTKSVVGKSDSSTTTT